MTDEKAEKTEKIEKNGKTAEESNNSVMVELSGINCSFGSKQVLHDVSFKLKRGGLTAFLGLNGAGKSTTMKIMNGFLYPDSGKVSIGGKDPKNDYIEMRKMIGYLPEENILHPVLTLRENLKFISDIMGFRKKYFSERLDEIVEIFELKDVLNRPAGELSKGYKQRCSLAVSMFHDPEILILDEPSSGLDPKQQESFHELIKKLAEEKTVLISTHIISGISDLADNYLVIFDGRIIYDGPSDISQSELRTYLLGETE